MVQKLISSCDNRSQYFLLVLLAAITITLSGCSDDNSSTSQSSGQTGTPAEAEKPVVIPPFNRDSAYAYVERQVELGPRNPGSEGIAAVRDWMEEMLKGYGAVVVRQDFNARLYTGDSYPSENIIASFNPGHRRRVILAAHYDTRFIAEEDPDEAKREMPIDGADDGASGVGVLIEIARIISENPIDLGIDIIMFDAEDQGKRGDGANTTETWCLGSQHWSRNPHKQGYNAEYGILLDMVGSKAAFFNKENVGRLYPHSNQVHQLYNKVWSLARAMGKGRYFQNRTIEGIVDDHYFVNRDAGIPMIDIINKPPNSQAGFGEHWHTHGDNMSIIDKNTLGSVGQVVTAVIYREAAGKF